MGGGGLLRQVELKDGRIVLGEFRCLDSAGNMLLYDSVERSGGDSGEPEGVRPFGLVLVPRAWRVSCKVGLAPEEALEVLSL